MTVLIGLGYAFVLVALIAFSGRRMTARQGVLWGAAGFVATGLAPGLGLPPESPDWGSTINAGRKLLSVYLHPAITPAMALLSLVLGLNLLADGLREQSLKD